MTTTVVRIYTPISGFIEHHCGPILSGLDAGIMDYYQDLGEAYAGFVDDDFVCCWGLVPPTFLSDEAYLWMWTFGPLAHQFLFIRHSQIQVKKFLSRYDSIRGHCKLNAHSAQRWLRWLGAKFSEPVNGTRPFVINRSA